jgi:hypothetical protein
MTRPIWSGNLSFGQLNIPVSLMPGERRAKQELVEAQECPLPDEKPGPCKRGGWIYVGLVGTGFAHQPLRQNSKNSAYVSPQHPVGLPEGAPHFA